MFIRHDGKTQYQVVLEAEMLNGIKEAKKSGLNLQPLIRDFIQSCLAKHNEDKQSFKNLMK